MLDQPHAGGYYDRDRGFTADITWTGYDNNQTNPLEFVNVEYQLNGGAWVRHPNVIGTDGDPAYTVRYTNAMGGNSGSATASFPAIAVVMGNMMQVRVCWSNNANAEVTTLDNVSVSNVMLASACLQPTVVVEPTPTGWCNSNSGTIKVTASNGTAGYDVSWSGPSSGNPAGTEIAASGGIYTITSLPEGTLQNMMSIADGGSFDFGNVILNSPDQKTFTISNPSAIDLILSGTSPEFVVKGGMHPDDFMITQPAVSTITGGNSITFSISFTPGALGARSCTLSIPNNDPDEDPYNITLNGTAICPTITFTATPANSCENSATGQIVIGDVMGGMGPYMYSIDYGASFQSEATFTGLAADSYQVLVRDANMCLSMVTSIMVNSFPSPACSIMGLTEVCENTGNVSYNGPPAMSAYAWSISGNGVINGASNGETVLINAGASGSYTLTLMITDANGCVSSCMQMVTIQANPICSIAGLMEVCPGSSGISYSGPANMYSYLWGISGNGSIRGSNDGQSVMIDAGASGTYTLSLFIEDINGCTSSCMKTVTVHDLPVCDIGGASAVCAGTTGHVFSAPAGMSLYSWNIMGNGNINGLSNTQNIVVDVGSDGIITLGLMVTDINGCINQCTAMITVNSQDDPSFSYLSAAFCKNDVNPVPVISGTAGGTFQSTPPGLNINGSNGIINLASSTPGSYKVTYTTNGPCPKSSNQSVKIDQVIPLVNAGMDQTICGLSTTLAGNIPSIGTGLWSIVSGSGGSIANPSQSNSAFSGVGGTTYVLKWTITNGACSVFDLVSITLQNLELSLPVISGPPTICPGLENIPYSVAPQPWVTNYVWSYSGTGVFIHNNGSPSITIDFGTEATSGQLMVQAINPCGGMNATGQLNIQLGNIFTCSFVNCLVSNLLVTDNTLALPGSPQIFKVSNQISSNATLPSPKTFLFKAGNTISLLPGFTVNPGVTFASEIEECPVIFPFQSSK